MKPGFHCHFLINKLFTQIEQICVRKLVVKINNLNFKR
jgi:hypothetical protein